ncbi:hypothetical protein HUU42_01285 [bacterium]|nr:hypothetical protein [bacterium]
MKEETKTSDSLLDHEYDVVMGILAPDSAVNFSRGYPTEVFVGRMIPTDIRNIFFVEGMQDTVLQRLMITTRNWYINYYEYDSTAKVSIQNNNQNVTLTYTGRGIYRDINNELKLKSQELYSLKILKEDGRVFTSNTTIPGNTFIDSISNMDADQDTFYAIPDSNSNWQYDCKITATPEPSYCVEIMKWANVPFAVHVYLFQDELSIWGSFLDSRNDPPYPPISTIYLKQEIRSINLDLGIFEHPAGSSYSLRFLVRLDSLTNFPIEQRSNIVSSKENDDVAGVFGAYNATRKEYVVIDATAGMGKRKKNK